MAIVRLLKVDVQYHFVAIDGDEIAELVSTPVTVAAGDWFLFSSNQSLAAVNEYIYNVETQLAEQAALNEAAAKDEIAFPEIVAEPDDVAVEGYL